MASINGSAHFINPPIYNVRDYFSRVQPDWSVIPSAGKCSKTQEQFAAEIRELARQMAMSEDPAKEYQLNRWKQQLEAQYLADVAPDRRLLFQLAKSAVNTLAGKPGKSEKTAVGELTLLDFLERRENEKLDMLTQRPLPIGGGGTLQLAHRTGGGYDIFIYCGSEPVMTNSVGGKFAYMMTKAELQKMEKFNDIYLGEYFAVRHGTAKELRELPDYLEEHPLFDVKA